MIGEIRDVETARDRRSSAALTGHLVLSTLHTNDAVETITRLLDMEIEPFLIASVARPASSPSASSASFVRTAPSKPIRPPGKRRSSRDITWRSAGSAIRRAVPPATSRDTRAASASSRSSRSRAKCRTSSPRAPRSANLSAKRGRSVRARSSKPDSRRSSSASPRSRKSSRSQANDGEGIA
ncbi:MAG: GspE family protein [Comamonadaceae bacterium]|nr:GspE family protein [Comamonadaceae bacterium]